MSQITHKHDGRRQTYDNESTSMTYGHFNTGAGHDVPVGGGRRRVTTTPPGLRATLETSQIKFVKQGAVRDPMHSSASCLLEPTAAAAAAANFTCRSCLSKFKRRKNNKLYRYNLSTNLA